MNYKKVYSKIIKNRQNNPLPDTIYGEIHHIMPRSLGGSDDENNLIRLTAREHFICHYLLAKMYPEGSFEWYKMNHAFMAMKLESYNQERYFNSRLYEALKENFSIVMRKNARGKNNSQYGTCWVYNEKLKCSKKINKNNLDEWLKNGWKIGRIVDWKNYFYKKKIKLCKKYNKKTFCWIHNKIMKENKKVNENALNYWLKNGWKLGKYNFEKKRKIKLCRKYNVKMKFAKYLVGFLLDNSTSLRQYDLKKFGKYKNRGQHIKKYFKFWKIITQKGIIDKDSLNIEMKIYLKMLQKST